MQDLALNVDICQLQDETLHAFTEGCLFVILFKRVPGGQCHAYLSTSSSTVLRQGVQFPSS